jgi:hypothetical protein
VSEKELRAVKMYKEGVKVNKICAYLNTSMAQLYRILKRHNVSLRRGERK